MTTDRNSESREDRMVVIVPCDENGRGGVWCDPEIVDLVRALNAGGVATIASCSGHGHRPGSIILADGRFLVIPRSREEWMQIEHLFPVDINGDTRTPPASIPAAEVRALVERIESVLAFVPDRGLPGIAKDELRRELAKLIPRKPE